MSLLSKSVGNRLLGIYDSVHTQTCSCGLYSLTDKPMWYDTKMDNLKKKFGKDESTAKQWKQIMPEVKFESTINVVTEKQQAMRIRT